jgi:Ca-activated chloride channel family protein
MNSLLQWLTGLTLLDPWMLWLMVLVPVGICVRFWRGAPAVSFSPGPFIEAGPLPSSGTSPTVAHRALPRSLRTWLLPLPRFLQILGLLLVVFALARPMERVQMPLEREGIDILLCLDVSSSMAANDMDPERNRLDLAVDAAAQFIAGRPDDRIGLIRFARYPDLICPLTLDHRALQTFIGELEMVEPDGLEDLTGIGTAVARGAQVLQASLAKSKVVILLTDGEENVATAQEPEEIGPLRAARLCEQLGVRVYTIAAGIGKRTQSGEWVALSTGQVQQLAEMTGGEFYEARDASAIADVYATIDELEKVGFQEPRYELKDTFLPFLIGALGLFLLSRLLHSTVLEVLP